MQAKVSQHKIEQLMIMPTYLLFTAALLTLCGNVNSLDTKATQEFTAVNATKRNIPIHFIPRGYILFDTMYGDLNKDSLEDCVLLIKGTDKANIIKDEYRGELDRNRRGIIILFKKKDGYELAVKNYDCFSSENEDGGVYYPPELTVELHKGKLSIHYTHGRYGYWSYTFRYQNLDFELIGYDESRGGAVTESMTSINFLTKKKQVQVNVNEKAEGGDEVFKETIKKISVTKLIKLSEIKDFDELDVMNEK